MSKGKNKKGKKKSFGINKQMLMNKIIGLFTNNPTKTYNYKQIAKQFEIKDDATKGLITAILYELHDNGSLVEISRGKFKLTTQGGYII